ncbi:MAG: hypothetical protein GQ546_10145 [Gammaproteobacteria bacterium]|nr:hypothetical protein [Gammaproteobacteria bacterium]
MNLNNNFYSSSGIKKIKYFIVLLSFFPSLSSSEMLFDGIASFIYRDLMEASGAELQFKNVKYSDYQVSFQYQYWRVKDKSVCANYKNNLLDYSKCTVEAKQFFTDTCTYLQSSQSSDKRKIQLKNMYCNAAMNFKPIIASISASNENETELSKAKSKCNSMILQAMNSKSASDISKRDISCKKYKEMRNH